MLKSFSLKRFSPFLTDILITSFTAAVVAVCNILLIKIIAKGLGPEEFGIYALVRRFEATVIPFSSLSIGIGLARYVAFYEGKGQKIESILPSAIIVSSISSLLFCLALLPFSGFLSKLFFNQEGRTVAFYLIFFLLVGHNLYNCLYAYYRGRKKMFSACIWDALLAIMTVLMAILFINMNNVNYLIFGIGVLSYLSLLSLLPKIYHGIRSTSWIEFKTMTKKLLIYSLPRAPGGMALMLIFSFGLLVSPYVGGIANAAYMSISISIFQILQVTTNSFGLVVLPKVANFVGSGNEQYLINKLRSIYDLILQVGLFIVIQLFLTIDFIVFIWVGQEYSAAVPITRIMLLSMMPFFFYTMMRNIVDAVEKRAINTFNLYLSLCLTAISSLILMKLGLGLSALAIGFDIGLISLGILTYFYMRRRYHIRFLNDNFRQVLLINILMGLFVFFVKYKIMENQYSYQNFAIIVLLQLLCGIVYYVVLKKSGSTWVREIEERITIK